MDEYSSLPVYNDGRFDKKFFGSKRVLCTVEIYKDAVTKMKHEQNHIEEMQEWQENQFNPGYYVGNGKIPPYLKAKGNPCLAAKIWLCIGILEVAVGVFVAVCVLLNYKNYPNSLLWIFGMILFVWAYATFCFYIGRRYFIKGKAQKAMKRAVAHHKHRGRLRG